MNSSKTYVGWLLTLSLSIALVGLGFARAQDPEEAPAAKPARKAAPSKPAVPKAAAAADAGPVEFTEPDEPAVVAVLESKPTTPAELVRAVMILSDLGRADLARPMLEKLSASKLDEQVMADLVAHFTSATFLRLGSNVDLAPQANQFASDVLRGAEAYYRNPQRVAAWIQQLSDREETVRLEAAGQLLQAHDAAPAALIAVLVDPAKASQQPAARAMLARMGEESVEPLLGALESPDLQLQVEATTLLGQLGAHQATAYLAAQSVSTVAPAELRQASQKAVLEIVGRPLALEEVRKMLRAEIGAYLKRARRTPDDLGQMRRLWHWEPVHKHVVPMEYRAGDADRALAARLAGALNPLSPDDVADQQLYLNAILEWAKNRGGLDRPLPTGAGTEYAAAARHGVNAIEHLFTQSLSTGQVATAIAAAQILGDIGSPELLIRSGATASPLVEALRHSDRRVRFAALEAIVKLKPTQAFAGANRIPESLGFFAASLGRPRAIVAHPRTAEGQQMAALLSELGFDAEIASTGREFFQHATSSADFQVAFVHMSLDHGPVDEVLVQLRRDARSAVLPVVLITLPEDPQSQQRAERLATLAGPAMAAARPLDLSGMKSLVDRILPAADRNIVGPDERLRQAALALNWLFELTDSPQKQFNLRPLEPIIQQALYVPALSNRAALVVGNMGTARGQVALLDLASHVVQPVSIREVAAVAFRRSVRKHGILLTSDQIIRQYDRYNDSATLDSDTQRVLSWLLDAIERKDSADQAKT